MRRVILILLLQTACVGHSCFVADTWILLENGEYRSIPNIKAGDRVLSYDLGTRSFVVRKVLALIRNRASRIFTIRTTKGTIEGVTGEHPFYEVKSQSWVKTAGLKIGDTLLSCKDGEVGSVQIIEISSSKNEVPEDVYNLTVEGPEHNYFADGVLVHNKSIEDDEPYIGVDFIPSESGLYEDIEEGVHDFYANLYGGGRNGDPLGRVGVVWKKSDGTDFLAIENCLENIQHELGYQEISCSVILQEDDLSVGVMVTSDEHGISDWTSVDISVISEDTREDSGN